MFRPRCNQKVRTGDRQAKDDVTLLVSWANGVLESSRWISNDAHVDRLVSCLTNRSEQSDAVRVAILAAAKFRLVGLSQLEIGKRTMKRRCRRFMSACCPQPAAPELSLVVYLHGAKTAKRALSLGRRLLVLGTTVYTGRFWTRKQQSTAGFPEQRSRWLLSGNAPQPVVLRKKRKNWETAMSKSSPFDIHLRGTAPRRCVVAV